MSILNVNPSVKEMGLKPITRNRLQEANVLDLADILVILDMTLQDLAQAKNLEGVVAKFTTNAISEVSLRRFGLVSQADLKSALERLQVEFRSSLFAELVAQDDEEFEAITDEETSAEDLSIEFFLDDSDDDLQQIMDSDDSTLDTSDLEDDALPLETLMIGVVAAKGSNMTPLMLDVVIDHVGELITGESALDLSHKELDGIVAQHVKGQGWPVDAPIYTPAQFAKRYTSVVAELSRIAEVVLTKTF